MKLLDVLARGLVEWPEGYEYIAQDGEKLDGQIAAYNYKPEFSKEEWSVPDKTGCYYMYPEIEVAQSSTDYKTAIITRAQWQQARDKLKEKPKVKANKDGWIRHRGGKCQVDGDVVVDYRMRNGEVIVAQCRAEALQWDHFGECNDIMAWRPHVASASAKGGVPGDGYEYHTTLPASTALDMLDNPGEPNDALIELIREGERAADAGQTKPLSEVVAAWRERQAENAPADPLAWRDRIRAIDAQRLDAEARHTEAMLAMDNERDGLVALLSGEGLMLAPVLVRRETEEDMSDWRNWRAGDLVEMLVTYADTAKAGQLMVVRKIVSESDGQPVRVTPLDDGSDGWWPYLTHMKFHSRP
jgi:hypothetical protein